MSDGARKGLAAGCLLLAVFSLIGGLQSGNQLVTIGGPVVFAGAAYFFWRRGGSD